MLSAALFDYDGTLANTDAIHHACWNEALASFGVRIDEAFYSRHCSGALSLHIAKQILAQFPAVTLAAQALADEKDARYQAWISTRAVPLMPGVIEVMEWLAAHSLAVGIVTGAPRSAIEPTLRQHRVFERLAVLVTRERVSRGKPAPDGYELAVRELAAGPAGSCVSFEDTRDGTLAAKAAGLLSVAIPHAYTAGHDFSAADHIVPSLSAALPWLEARLRATG